MELSEYAKQAMSLRKPAADAQYARENLVGPERKPQRTNQERTG
jgi:hypothetical protein